MREDQRESYGVTPPPEEQTATTTPAGHMRTLERTSRCLGHPVRQMVQMRNRYCSRSVKSHDRSQGRKPPADETASQSPVLKNQVQTERAETSARTGVIMMVHGTSFACTQSSQRCMPLSHKTHGNMHPHRALPKQLIIFSVHRRE